MQLICKLNHPKSRKLLSIGVNLLVHLCRIFDAVIFILTLGHFEGRTAAGVLFSEWVDELEL
jgi:hypothetical protein